MKKILIGLGVVLALVLLVGFLLPAKMEVSKSIRINAPAGYVFEEINDLKRNSNWSYWNSLYEQMTVTYGSVSAGLGAVSEWDGPESGKGKMTIVESIPNQSIKMDLDFMDQGTAQAWYTFATAGEETQLTTGFSSDMGLNPIGRIIGAVLVKPEMEKAFDYNLTHLKAIAEAKPRFTIAISEENIQPISYVGLSTIMRIENQNEISAQMGKSYGELMKVLGKAKVQINGYPMCLYPMYDEAAGKMEMVCALPVAADAKLPAKYAVMKTGEGKVVKGIHTGSYHQLGSTHEQINKYIAFKKLEINGVPWETYVTDPGIEADTTKWITEVYYPVKE